MRTSGAWNDGSELVVLAWHNIDPTWRWPAPPDAGRAGLSRQLRALRRFTSVVPLEDGLHALREGRRLPPRAVALTFDDGYRDNLTVGTSILRELGLPATVFLLPEVMDGRSDPWWERLSWAVTKASAPELTFAGSVFRLDDPAIRAAALGPLEDLLKSYAAADRELAMTQIVDALEPVGDYSPDELFMDWDEAAKLSKSGIAIGSHTCDHAILARESAQDQYDNVQRARARLQDRLGKSIGTLAYPNGQIGDYDSATTRAAALAGYSFGLTAWGLVNNAKTHPYEIRRRAISPLDSATRVTLGLIRGVRRARQRMNLPENEAQPG